MNLSVFAVFTFFKITISLSNIKDYFIDDYFIQPIFNRAAHRLVWLNLTARTKVSRRSEEILYSKQLTLTKSNYL